MPSNLPLLNEKPQENEVPISQQASSQDEQGTSFVDIFNKDPYVISTHYPDAVADLTASYNDYFIAPFKLEVVKLSAVYRGTTPAGGAYTFSVLKTDSFGQVTTGQAVNLKDFSAGDEIAIPLSTVKSRRVLEVGDILTTQLVEATGLTNFVLVTAFIPLAQGHYRNI